MQSAWLVFGHIFLVFWLLSVLSVEFHGIMCFEQTKQTKFCLFLLLPMPGLRTLSLSSILQDSGNWAGVCICLIYKANCKGILNYSAMLIRTKQSQSTEPLFFLLVSSPNPNTTHEISSL